MKTLSLVEYTEALKRGATVTLSTRDAVAFNAYLSEWIDIRFSCVVDKDKTKFKKIC